MDNKSYHQRYYPRILMHDDGKTKIVIYADDTETTWDLFYKARGITKLSELGEENPGIIQNIVNPDGKRCENCV